MSNIWITRKRDITIVAILMTLLAVSLIFFLETEKRLVTALSLIAIMVSGLALFVFFLFILARLRVNKLSTKQELIFCNCMIFILPLIPISYIVLSAVIGGKDILSNIHNIIIILPPMVTVIRERGRIKKKMSELSESDNAV
jgi:hypothetical protein